MRDFSDANARPFSQAKQDDLVSMVRSILAGNGNVSITDVVSEPEEESEKLKGKSRSVKNAIKRIENKKKRNKEKQDGN